MAILNPGTIVKVETAQGARLGLCEILGTVVKGAWGGDALYYRIETSINTRTTVLPQYVVLVDTF